MTRSQTGTGTGWWTLPRRLAAFALAVAVGHHVGVGLERLGQVGRTGTRWADWVDLLVPYCVVGTAAAVLVKTGASRRVWVGFVLAAVVYTQGHGIHLAGNSVDNAIGGKVAHLWDEDVGHWIWYLGLTFLVAVIVHASPRMAVGPQTWLFVVLAAFTWFDNTVEGGVPYLGMAAAVLVGGYALRRGVLPIAAAYGIALVLLITWGVWRQGFPQFSQLGWI